MSLSLLIFNWAIFIALVLVGIACVLTTYRLIKGPRAQDRVLGLDTLYVNAMIILVLLALRYNDNTYMTVALIIALLGFTATAAFAKFLMRGEVIE